MWPMNKALPALLFALGGCATVGPDFSPPAPPTATAFAMAGDVTPAAATLDPIHRVAGAWWEAFGSEKLNALIAEALSGNQTVAAAMANLEVARAEDQAQAGHRSPGIDFGVSAKRQRFNTAAFGFAGFPSPTVNLLELGPTVSYDLDVFGGERRGREATRAFAAAEAARADAAYLIVTSKVAMAAAQIAGLGTRIQAMRAVVADDRRLIEIQQASIDAGGSAPAAGISRRQQLAEDEALLAPLQMQLAQARHGLALLVGHTPSEWTAPDFAIEEFSTPSTAALSVPSQWVRSRPDIQAAEADLHVATARVGVATADLYPKFRLSAGISQLAAGPGALFGYKSTAWDFGAGSTSPLFHGGILQAGRRAAQARASRALSQYRQTVLTAFAQVADVLSNLAQDEGQLAALGEAESEARANLANVKGAYDLGGVALLSVIEAQRHLDVASSVRNAGEQARLQDLVELYAVTATDWRAAVKPM